MVCLHVSFPTWNEFPVGRDCKDMFVCFFVIILTRLARCLQSGRCSRNVCKLIELEFKF